MEKQIAEMDENDAKEKDEPEITVMDPIMFRQHEHGVWDTILDPSPPLTS